MKLFDYNTANDSLILESGGGYCKIMCLGPPYQRESKTIYAILENRPCTNVLLRHREYRHWQVAILEIQIFLLF
jgi:hypothetical protein